MSRPEIKLDQHGFPIPEKLSEEKSPRRGAYKKGNPFQKGWVRALVLLVIFAGIATMLLKDQFPAMVAQWYLQAAVDDLNAGNLESAIANSDGAIAWTPDDPRGYYLRGELHRETGDLDAALEDLTKAIDLESNWLPAIASRAMVFQQMHRHQESAADYTRAITLSGESDEAMYRNNRAYARALGNFELEEGLADVEIAISAKEKDLEYDSQSAFTRLDLSAYLDTRGLLQHLLGNQEQAMEDLNKALKLIEDVESENPFASFTVGSPEQLQRVAAIEGQMDESRAVMYEHRALVHEKLGDAAAAARDHALAKQLGYNPEAGVF